MNNYKDRLIFAIQATHAHEDWILSSTIEQEKIAYLL